MIINTALLALRHLAKNRLHTFINITGLALGLATFLLSEILVSYEYNHDHMFAKRDQIYTVGSIFAPSSGEPIREYSSIRSAYGPLFKREIEGIPLVARTLLRERVLSVDKTNFYFNMRFADSGFTRLFDFNYLYGQNDAIDDPFALIITASTANKLFGREDVLGESVTLGHKLTMHIGAVIEDVAPDSHINSSFLPNSSLTVIAPITALVGLGDFKLAGDFKGLHPADMTYVLLPQDKDRNWLQQQVNAVATRHMPKSELSFISHLNVRPLVEANTMVWQALGFPLLKTVRLLGLLILIVACVNYTNLATAQSFGRTREVGLRKTFGGSTKQLLIQFLMESILMAVLAMMAALCIIELVIPFYNVNTGKNIILDYGVIVPVLLVTAVLVGLLSGAYPAFVIAQGSPIYSLKNTLLTGRKGGLFRNLMIASQFGISIFIVAMVLIISFQNQKLLGFGFEFPKAKIVVLAKIDAQEIRQKHAILSESLTQLPGVETVVYSSIIPFLGTTNSRKVTLIPDDEAASFTLQMVSVGEHFMQAYNIKALSGRPLSSDIQGDVFDEKRPNVNVVINLVGAKKLGFANAKAALGQIFFKIDSKRHPTSRQYTIVGLMPNQYFLGVHSKIQPLAFMLRPSTWHYASIKLSDELSKQDSSQTLNDIDKIWAKVINTHPIKRKMLDYYFNYFFRIPSMINSIIALFGGIALSLALIGLYGLAAFMAKRRTKEIGLRKVMGASEGQIVRLLTLQFLMPIIGSLLVAIPLAWLASDIYLGFFEERIGFVIPLILLASLLGVIAAMLITATHAIKIARATPMRSLRHK